jgi:hypothetical protein
LPTAKRYYHFQVDAVNTSFSPVFREGADEVDSFLTPHPLDQREGRFCDDVSMRLAKILQPPQVTRTHTGTDEEQSLLFLVCFLHECGREQSTFFSRFFYSSLSSCKI